MRRVWLVPALVAVALVLQLTVIDGLHLPRGGVPDLVLVLVVAIATAGGPVAGMVTGFAAGLCADIAPPGSPLIGQYALVFCLAGWAAGSLGRFTKRSPLRALAVAAVVIAAAETLAAGLGKALEPSQVSVAEIRQFLPITIAYDLLICPFVLYLVILTVTSTASRGLATSSLAGTGLLSVHGRPKQAGHARRRHQPRLDPAAARAGDGWVSGGSGRHPGSAPRANRGTRLHPGAGLPGSASGYARQASPPVHQVKLRMSARRRGDAAIGGVVGSAQGRDWRSRRHPGMLAGTGHQLRFHGEFGGAAARANGSRPGGSAPRKNAPAAPVRIDFRGWPGGSSARQIAPARITFRGWPGGSSARQSLAAAPVRINFRNLPGGFAGLLAPPGRRPPRINFSARGGGSEAARSPTGRRRPKKAAPRLRTGASRSALVMSAPAALTRSVPSVQFRTAPAPIARRPAAAPKFRARSKPPSSSALTTARAGGGALSQTPFRAKSRATGRSRLRLASRRRGSGMLGGGGVSSLRPPPARTRKVPKFGYGRRTRLTFLTRWHVTDRWLARRRAGRRSGSWLIGRRTGGLR